MMYLSTQSSDPFHTIFGSGYVPEQHGDETRRYLPSTEDRELAVSFDEVIKALRAALSLR